MQDRPPYFYGGQTFRSLGAIADHVQEFLDFYNRVVGEEKFDSVLADVVVDRHYIWRHHGIRPTSFKFVYNADGDGRHWDDSLAGFFGPEWGWHRFSYRKALRQTEPDMESEFPRLCRERFRAVWRSRIFREGGCEVPGCLDRATDVDHALPTHTNIVSQCWAELFPEDRVRWWDQLRRIGQPPSFGGGNHFGLPDEHPVTTLYDTLTGDTKYRLLCQDHHKQATRGKLNLPGKKRWPPPPLPPEVNLDDWFKDDED